MTVSPRLWSALAAGLIATTIAAFDARADATPPTPEPPPTDTSGDKKGDTAKPKAIETRSLDGYRAAYQAIYQHGEYGQGIAQLRALKRDDDVDVANLIGFASRKLGRYDDARHWYEKALAADPRHVRTWQYYGMWHAEQGNLIKAAEFLDRVESLCGGTACAEYKDLKGAIAGTVTY